MVLFEMPIPWWAKLSTKLVLARLPLNYAAWRQFPIFKHGYMGNPEYALSVFQKHFAAANLFPGFVSLELGPGDSLFSALISYGLGGRSTYLVDTGAYAIQDVAAYHQMARLLEVKGFTLPDFKALSDLESVLATVSAHYCTNGLHSLRQIPTKSVDFIWSNAVLEHIRYQDFEAVCQELRRIIKPGGICSHEIDLRDHLGGGLNSLRFPTTWWELDWVANSGFYTNRIRHNEMLKIFARTNFKIADHIVQKTWEKLPISRAKMAPEFRDCTDEDLKVSVFSVVLEPI